MTGIGTAFAFVPVSIAGLTGVAVTSTVAASRFAPLRADGDAPAAALTGGFHSAFLVCGAIGLAAVPITLLLLLLLRRRPATAAGTVPAPSAEGGDDLGGAFQGSGVGQVG